VAKNKKFGEYNMKDTDKIVALEEKVEELEAKLAKFEHVFGTYLEETASDLSYIEQSEEEHHSHDKAPVETALDHFEYTDKEKYKLK
jgi:hypothetical protein